MGSVWSSDQRKVGIPARLHLPSSRNMFLHKNDMCPRDNWVGNCIELACGRLCNYINYQSSKSGREHTHEVICLKSCSTAVFGWQGDIPTLQEFIARGKGGGWTHTMLGKHKTHTHTHTCRDSDLLIDLYAFHSSSQASHHGYHHHCHRRHQSSRSMKLSCTKLFFPAPGTVVFRASFKRAPLRYEWPQHFLAPWNLIGWIGLIGVVSPPSSKVSLDVINQWINDQMDD